MSLPTPEEISPSLGIDLDEKYALEHFYGKTQSEAAKLFFESSLYFEGDLKWMGTSGFTYYFPALEPYLVSKSSAGDSDIVNAIIGTVRTKLQYDPIAIYADKASVLRILIYCSENLAKFDATPAIYGNLGKELRTLIEIVQSNGRIEPLRKPLSKLLGQFVQFLRKVTKRSFSQADKSDKMQD